jgi:hypothetical protein
MYLVLIVLTQLVLFFFSFYHSLFYFIIFGLLLYVIWYRDGAEFNGYRTWDAFRALRLWKLFNPVQIEIYNASALKRRSLFVFVPSCTPMPLLWTMGFHGGNIPAHLEMCYLMPNIMFRIPFLRDLLLWSGAVSNQRDSILNLLQRNRSVCYSPSDFRDVLKIADDRPQFTFPDDELFDFAIKEGVPIVPVVCAGETERYNIYTNSWIRAAQMYCVKRIGFPEPLLFWARIFQKEPPSPLYVYVGAPIDSKVYEKTAELKQVFGSALKSYTVAGLDKTLELEGFP